MLPFGLTIMAHVNLPRYTVETELSLTYWGLRIKRKPEKGLSILIHVGPLGVYVYNRNKQEEWLNRLIKNSDENIKQGVS